MAIKYFQKREQGYTFLFAYDEEFPEHLHIFARHLATPEIAINTFFHQTSKVYNEVHDRYESTDGDWDLYWTWVRERRRVVLVIACARTRG